jgi:hypothetical protein
MITIAQVVENIISQKPFLEEFMADDLINYSSLARSIKPQIEKSIGRPVNSSAIVMALKRYVPHVDFKLNLKLERVSSNLGDITVRSNLTDYTYRNSVTLIKNQKKLLEFISQREDVFFTFSQGVYEVNIVISSDFSDEIEKAFGEEICISKLENLSSVTMRLPSDNVKMTGLYYHVLKKLAWNKINIIEVISTTNEFTIIVDEDDIGNAFNVLKNLKKK